METMLQVGELQCEGVFTWTQKGLVQNSPPQNNQKWRKMHKPYYIPSVFSLGRKKDLCKIRLPKTIKNDVKCTNPTIFLRRFHMDAKRTCAKFASQKQSKWVWIIVIGSLKNWTPKLDWGCLRRATGRRATVWGFVRQRSGLYEMITNAPKCSNAFTH